MPMPSAKLPNLPHLANIDVEQAVLGALLLNNEAFHYLGELAPAHFSEPLHIHLFAEAKRQHEAGKFVSPLTLKDSFPPDITVGPDGMKIPQYLARLAAEATTVINAADYAAHIKALSEMRACRDVLYGLLSARDGLTAPDIAMREAFDAIDAIRIGSGQRADRDTTMNIGRAAAMSIETMQAQMEGRAPVRAVFTGLTALDKQTGGLKPGELIIAAGRPGMGKTTLCSSVARAAAAGVTDGNGEIRQSGVAFFSLEMPRELITARLLADQAFKPADPIHYTAIINADLGIQRGIQDSRHQRLVEAQREFAAMPLILDTSPRLSIGEIAAKSRAIAAKLRKGGRFDLDLVVIDYLKFVKATDRYKGQRVYEVGEISAALKILARELDTAVLLLAQISRKAEERSDKRPELADLRESGDLEADADVVLLLFREAYYLRSNPNIATDPALEHKLSMCENALEIIIAKQRMGPTGSVSVYCNMACSAVRSA
jgi:replicative DNA helicase